MTLALNACSILGATLIILAPFSASAWASEGHMTTAALAYRQLSPGARSKVDELLTHHPAAVKRDFDREKHHSLLEPGLYGFLRASTWPDDIKRQEGLPSTRSWQDSPRTRPSSETDAHPRRIALSL